MKMRTNLSVIRSRGFTIIEFMVAGMLGLILLGAVSQLFIGSNTTMNLQRQLADLQDSGRFALWYLKEDIQRAGWPESTSAPATVALGPGDDGESGINYVEFNVHALCPDGGGAPTACTSDGGADANDSIFISYEAPAAGGVDCSGANVVGIIKNRYFINNNRELSCQGNGAGAVAQPLVSNVDSFQLLYGIDQNEDLVVEQYVTAVEVVNPALIVSVRMALLVAGVSNTSLTQQVRTYQVLDRSLDFDDRVPRRIFSMTVFIPNKT